MAASENMRETSTGIGSDYEQLPFFGADDQSDPMPKPVTIASCSIAYGGQGWCARTLDLGCGSGALLKRIGQCYESAELVGIDISFTACTEARRRLEFFGN
ncbi:class I SAM-dependent methyltransferase [Collimonas humicola]|uniref:class I SAM-dependent methyltransferase n=1 Tax=Collimonas humicola TaxID=2825886 RepID=UPI001B8CF9FB|nr:class I SAM-dependent methyltransferase [Collimonas humicola]